MSFSNINRFIDQTNRFNQLNSIKKNRIIVKKDNQYIPAVLFNNSYQSNKGNSNFIYSVLYPDSSTVKLKKEDFLIYNPTDLIEKSSYLRERSNIFKPGTQVKIVIRLSKYKYYSGLITRYDSYHDQCDISVNQIGLITNTPFFNNFILPNDSRYTQINEYIFFLNDIDTDSINEPEETPTTNTKEINKFLFNKDTIIKYNKDAIPNQGNIYGDETMKPIQKSNNYEVNNDINTFESIVKNTFLSLKKVINDFWSNFHIRFLFFVVVFLYFLNLNSKKSELLKTILSHNIQSNNSILIISFRVFIILLISFSVGPLLLVFFIILCLLFIFKIKKNLVPLDEEKNALKYLFNTFLAKIVIGSTVPGIDIIPPEKVFWRFLGKIVYFFLLLGFTINNIINLIKEKIKLDGITDQIENSNTTIQTNL